MLVLCDLEGWQRLYTHLHRDIQKHQGKHGCCGPHTNTLTQCHRVSVNIVIIYIEHYFPFCLTSLWCHIGVSVHAIIRSQHSPRGVWGLRCPNPNVITSMSTCCLIITLLSQTTLGQAKVSTHSVCLCILIPLFLYLLFTCLHCYHSLSSVKLITSNKDDLWITLYLDTLPHTLGALHSQSLRSPAPQLTLSFTLRSYTWQTASLYLRWGND